MVIQTIVIFLSSIVNIWIGIEIFRKRRESLVNQTFALLTGAIGLWTASTVFLSIYPGYLSGVVTISLGICIGTTFYLFARVFPSTKIKPSLRFYLPLILILLLLIFGAFTKLTLKDVKVEDDSAIPVFGPLYFVLLPVIMILMPFALYRFFKTYKASRSIERLRMNYLLAALIGFTLTVSFFNGILPTFGIYNYVNVGPSLSVIWMLFISYSISKYRLFGIQYILGRGIFYLIIGIFPFIFFHLLYLIISVCWEDIYSFNSIVVELGMSILFAIVFWKSNEEIRDYIGEKIMYKSFNPEDILSQFTKKLSTELNLEKIGILMISIFTKALGVRKMGLVLFDKDNQKVLFKKFQGFENDKQFNMRHLLEVIHYWDAKKHSEILVREEIEERGEQDDDRLERIIEMMRNEEIDIILPLNRKVRLNGVVFLGKKPRGGFYAKEEVDFLESVVANVSVAFSRAILFAEVSKFNVTLQKKIEKATTEIKERNISLSEALMGLKEARRKERDMIDIMGHELRTPMSIVKGSFAIYEMFVKKAVSCEVDKKTDKKLREYRERINENIDREIKLINTLLGATKIDKGKLELNKEVVDTIDVIEDGIVGQQAMAKKKGLYIKFNKPKDIEKFPAIYADRARIQEVMDNILSNAVKYTNKGGVTVNVEHDDKFVTFHITDTGQGMPKDALQNLGKKFYRVQQYTKESEKRDMKMVRAGGTGLGLYVTFGLVKEHGGKIWVESEIGKGSIFHFTIPIYKGQKIKDGKEEDKDVFKRKGLKK